MSRFDVECFDPPPDAELICCICQGVLDRPMETPCRHVFCKICIETWLRNGDNCPSCRAPVELDRLVATLPLLSNLLNKLRVYCVNRANNCQMSWFVESFDDDHAKVCEYRQVVCRFADCKTQVLVQNIQKHEDKCEYRPVICKKICGLTIIAKNKSTHACVPLLKETIDDLKKKLHESHLEIERLRTRNEELTDRLNDPDATRDTDIDSVLGWDPVDSNNDDDDDDEDSFNSLADFLMSSSSNTHNSDQDVADYSDGLSLNDAESSLTDSMVGFSESSYEDAYDPSAIMISSDSSSGYSTLRRPLPSPPPPRGSPGSQIFSDPDSVVYTTTDSPPNPSSPNGVTDFNSNSPIPSPNMPGSPGSPGSPELDDTSRHSDSYCDVTNQSFALDHCDRSPSPASPPRASSSHHATSSSRGHVASTSLGHVSPTTVPSRDRYSSPSRAHQTSPRRKSTDDDDDSARDQRSSRKRRRGARRRDRSDDSANSDRSRSASRRAKKRRRRSDSSDGDYRRRRYRSRRTK